MGKAAKRYYGGQTEVTTEPRRSSRRRKENIEKEDRPDQTSREFFYDAVDDFHHDRDKIYLDKAKRKPRAQINEEVFAIRSDEDDDDDEDEEDDDEEMDQNGFLDDQAVEVNDDESDMQSDISGEEDEEGYLPSADAWGKRRKAYYSTDFVGDDRAGLSGSDIEAAELEEQEAITLQKRLLQQMTDDDFKLDSAEPAAKKKTEKAREDQEKHVVRTDLSNLSEEEKLELLQQQSPELLSLIEEYQSKSQVAKKYLEPISNALVDYIKNSWIDPKTRSQFDWVIKKYELYMNYLVNLQFYFVLKAMRQSIDNHPVIDRIMSLKKLVNEMDSKYGHFDQNIERLAEKLDQGADIEKHIRMISIGGMKGKKVESKAKVEKVENAEGIDSGKKKRWGMDEKAEEMDGKDGAMEDDGEEKMQEDAMEKRGVTYEIERNKGLTPHRKKEQRNPRVKNRSRFKKAVHKKRSQLPDARKELQKYGGEIRGIKANVVRSVKLH